MKTKSIIKDELSNEVILSRQVKSTESEKELFDKIWRFDILIRKSLVWIPSVLELYKTINNLSESLKTERENNCYNEGFKSGFFYWLKNIQKISKHFIKS